jgi:hypothetical protein
MKRKQLTLNLFKGTRGGRRPNSGRKRIHSKGVAHRTRERVKAKQLLHVNFKYRLNIKNKMSLRFLKRAILHARSKNLKVIHFSLQSNHIHLILEASSNFVLTQGMRALTVTFAKNIKKGSIQLERYHLHVLKTLRETKNAINYVLLNEQKHSRTRRLTADSFSSLQLMSYEFARMLAKENSLSLVWHQPPEPSFLDPSFFRPPGPR